MNRRDFIKAGIATGAAFSFEPASQVVDFHTKHLIWIINGNGSRKKDWYENPAMFPNYARLVREGFVYEESLNDTVANHDLAVLELLTGNAAATPDRMYPTPLHYVRQAYGDFFRATQKRELRIERLAWNTSPGTATAKGEATVRAQYADRAPLDRRVDLQMEIVLRDGQARLRNLALFPDSP